MEGKESELRKGPWGSAGRGGGSEARPREMTQTLTEKQRFLRETLGSEGGVGGAIGKDGQVEVQDSDFIFMLKKDDNPANV